MLNLLEIPQKSDSPVEPWDPASEALFREARRRERRRRIRRIGVALASFAVVGTAVGVGINAVGSSATKHADAHPILTGSSPKVLTCSGSSAVRPTTLVVSCADANTSLQSTHWSTWGAGGASGTTTFSINLCTPYCAASPISHFPNSAVTLSAPVSSRHGTYFSHLVVNYGQGAARKTFSFAWTPGVSR